jgi:hypothetical protein
MVTGSTAQFRSGGARVRSLVPHDPTQDATETRVFDGNGRLMDTPTGTAGSSGRTDAMDHLGRDSGVPSGGFDHESVDGSWYVRLTPRYETADKETHIHGAMRIESWNPASFVVSGDIYVEAVDCDSRGSSFPENPLVIDEHWYPQFSPETYSWYFRSESARFRPGAFGFSVQQFVWDEVDEDFSDERRGSMAFYADPGYFDHVSLPKPTIRLEGVASLREGIYDVVAYKTSPYYRGCIVEIDVMDGRPWTGRAERADGLSVDFNGVYRDVGLDVFAVVNERDVPEDESLTLPDLERLLSDHRSDSPFSLEAWHLWVLVCSRLGTTDALGMMFDDTPPHREGIAVFADPRFGDYDDIDEEAREKALGDVPLAVLRTALHEVGHAFNLFHPRDDVHPVPTGTTLMNQTADLMDRATGSRGFPSNTTLAFHHHNRRSLVHGPDPQVRPGWKEFGYGHGGVGSSPSGGGDLSFDRSRTQSELVLDLDVPSRLYLGAFAIAGLQLSNTGETAHSVVPALNVREDHLRLHVKGPDGSKSRVRSPVLVCSNRRPVRFDPGSGQRGFVQLLYANRGHPFSQAGRYVVTAELDAGRSVLTSEPQTVIVGPPRDDTEVELGEFGLDDRVSRSVALGYPDPDGTDSLKTLATDFRQTDFGTAAALILANASSRDVYDFRSDRRIRRSDLYEAGRYLDMAFDQYDPSSVARIAAAVLPPGEEDSPVMHQLEDRMSDDQFGDATRRDALDILNDFRRNVDCHTAAWTEGGE